MQYEPCKLTLKAHKLGINPFYLGHFVHIKDIKKLISKNESELNKMFKVLNTEYKDIVTVKTMINLIEYGLKAKEITYYKKEDIKKINFIEDG